MCQEGEEGGEGGNARDGYKVGNREESCIGKTENNMRQEGEEGGEGGNAGDECKAENREECDTCIGKKGMCIRKENDTHEMDTRWRTERNVIQYMLENSEECKNHCGDYT